MPTNLEKSPSESALGVSGTASPPPLTKIVATLGPATDDDETIEKLITNGVSVFRLNFSHGSFDHHKRRLEMVRDAAASMGAIVAVLGDLQGPKIRVGEVEEGGIWVRAGEDMIFRRDLAMAERRGDDAYFPCTYEKLVDEVFEGQRVLINDGAIRALATECADGEVRCRVTVGGLVTTGKGINLPDSDISAPAITAKDWECAEWAARHELDFLAFSFVRRGEEVRSLKDGLNRIYAESHGVQAFDNPDRESFIPVIAKIEKPQAMENIEAILAEADGLMVARGDLGVEMDIAQVPVIQKILIEKAREFGKPCIVATQMLESMIDSSSPTRAEASDVANAIFDGADAVMLSGETAVGKHGPKAVDMMRRIAHATESRLREIPRESTPSQRHMDIRHRTAALAHAAWHLVYDLDLPVVALWSESGGTARYMSRVGIQTPIMAFSSDARAVRRMSLLYGVVPVLTETLPVHRSEFGRMIDEHLMTRGYAQAGERVAALAGKPFGKSGRVNTLAVRTVGSDE